MAASLWLRLQALLCLALLCTSAQALRYDEAWTDYNLNQNQTATEVLDYWGEWENHTYWPSPENWRVPFYTVFLDRLANGDPTNDDANGTAWEHDVAGTQLRAGGDVQGFINTLDYIAGLGIKVSEAFHVVLRTSDERIVKPIVFRFRLNTEHHVYV